jgi:hypothetical protein
MDQIERHADMQEMLRQAINGALEDVYVAAPVRIVSFDPLTATADALLLQPLRVDQQDGTQEWKQATKFSKCPVVFLQGGGFTIFAPPQAGDEALAVFCHRSIDDWWYYGGTQQRSSLRRFSKDDAILICGVFSRPNVPLTPIDPAALEIRSDSGTVKLRLDTTGVTITAPIVTVNGNLAVTGTVSSGTVSLQTHVHSGVQTGGSDTGPPLP